MTDNS